MTPDLRIQRAVLLSDARGVRAVAHTDGFDTPEAERVAVLFGARPPGVACPGAVFACRFGRTGVAVVTVADRPGGALGFRFLVLGRDLYRHLGDPFAVADRYPPEWAAAGHLADLEWPHEVLPARTLEQLDEILKNGDVSLLLGGAQALVDGNRVLLTRDAPAALVRDLWQLLPDRARADLWPASFAFAADLGFHLAAGPTLPGPRAGGLVLVEEAVRDYPQSHYELGLQLAIESGDRAALGRLLARRTSDDTIRLGLGILGFAVVVAAVFRFAL